MVWRLHTKLYKSAWNVSPNNSETVGQKDLRLGQIVYTLVFYNIYFLLLDSEDDLYNYILGDVMTVDSVWIVLVQEINDN